MPSCDIRVFFFLINGLLKLAGENYNVPYRKAILANVQAPADAITRELPYKQTTTSHLFHIHDESMITNNILKRVLRDAQIV